MIIELKGAGYVNKGAELMLDTILAKKEIFGNKSKFIVNMFSGSFSKRRSSGVGHLAWLHTWNYLFVAQFINMFFLLIPKKIRRLFDIYLTREIDYVLDISGFIYSDQFNPKASSRIALYYEKIVENGTKIILMPQAVGPFENEQVKESVLKIFKLASLIFVRDKISFSYLKGLNNNIDNVFLCPDFTLFLKGNNLKLNMYADDKVYIIPNEKIFSSKKIDFKNYIASLNQIISFCNNKRVEVFFLIHEAKKDLELVKKISLSLEYHIEHIIEKKPLKIKQIIKQSKFVVSSRYHGLINALYQNVPVIATGWSHKYYQLLSEYDIETHMIKYSEDDNINKLLEDLFDEDYINILKNKMAIENNRREEVLNWMWNKIESELEFNS